MWTDAQLYNHCLSHLMWILNVLAQKYEQVQTLLGVVDKNDRSLFLKPKANEYGNTPNSKDTDKGGSL